MKKYYVLILALLTTASLLKAQFVPVGSKWYYGTKSGNGNPAIEGVYTYTCEKDTIINSETYSKIVYHAPDDSTSRTFYVTKDSVAIYYWHNPNKRTLFKTDCQMNDTILIDCFLSNQFPPYQDTVISLNVVINKITYEKLNSLANDSLKLFQYNIINFSGIPYSSRVGMFVETLININNDDNRDLIVLTQQLAVPEGGDYLRCFSSMAYNYKSKSAPVNISCDFNNVGIYESVKKNEIYIYPNPNLGLFSISFNDNVEKTINVFDVFGNLVYVLSTTDSKTNINLPDKAKGIYFINIQTADRQQYNSKIIVE
ncbi:MAG: T9SS type A sorting domain-containing protein [Bacteroidia bacterium]|nr:T9SS type A sorting domain-containing protein [Bacteroidia bacterium]